MKKLLAIILSLVLITSLVSCVTISDDEIKEPSDVSVEGEKATIYFKYEFSEGNGATMPYARCLVVTMEKTNISTVEFIKK